MDAMGNGNRTPEYEAKIGKAIANLKPFKKGDPRAGRPKGPTVKKLVQMILETPAPQSVISKLEKQGLVITERTYREIVVASMLAKAIKGSVRHAEFIFDRAYGKVEQGLKINKTEEQHTMIFEVVQDEQQPVEIEAEIVPDENDD